MTGGTGMRTFLWTGYAASPRLLRYCIGLSHPSFVSVKANAS